MTNAYIVYYFKISPITPWSEILLAQLQSLPFQSFQMTDIGFDAFIPENLHYNNFLESIPLFNSSDVKIHFRLDKIEPANWNAKWESDFKPILVGDNCVIRADFHPKFNKEYELLINPKMSFGTGHHQTTFMLVEFLLNENVEGSSVLDMGCGTGILAIIASKMRAKNIDAIDNDPWCIKNTKENAVQNQCKNINVVFGNQIIKKSTSYDFILANINRNILLDQFPSYAKALSFKGALLISGFYIKDIPVLKERAEEFGLQIVEEKEKDTWCALKLKNEQKKS